MNEEEKNLPSNGQVFIVSLVCNGTCGHPSIEESRRSLFELEALLDSISLKVAEQFIQKIKSPRPATLIGKGKLEEIGLLAKAQDISWLVFDCELGPAHVRNIKKLTGLEAVDRNNIIFEIFARNARTAEAKIQVEISKLRYSLPRLTSMWGHLSRQKGGIGVMGGEGEQQIELDRRIIRDRIARLERQLVALTESRRQQSKQRLKNLLTIALVGHTNAGKSSLFNQLCCDNVPVENKLFVTLDPTYRMISPITHPPMALVDTVGLIRNLPTALVEGFKSTLHSAQEADLVLMVIDISDINYLQHIKLAQATLVELGRADNPVFIVFNKRDLLNSELTGKLALRAHPHSLLVSTFNQEDMTLLRQKIIEFFLGEQGTYELFVRHEEGKIHAILAAKTKILQARPLEKGTYYTVQATKTLFAGLNLGAYLMGPKTAN